MANSAAATLDRTFEACAHPVRRAILERLAAAELTVGEASAGLGVSKPTISRHLRVLEQAGAVVRIVDGRTHRLHISQGPLLAASLWIDCQRELWERKFDAVERFLAAEKVAGAPPRGAPDAETGP
jgi:DNA-binding transcriptional ArsR family regulator